MKTSIYFFVLTILFATCPATAQDQLVPDFTDEAFFCSADQIPAHQKLLVDPSQSRFFDQDEEGNLALKELGNSGETITLEDFQLALGSEAWQRSDGLPGSTKDELRIGVYFLDGNKKQRDWVEKYAPMWTGKDGARVKFIFGDRSKNHIRISFVKENSSQIGNIASKITDLNEPTMHLLDVDESKSETRIRRVILHEFGHALGLRHEHQHPQSGLNWNKAEIVKSYKTNNGCNDLTEQQCGDLVEHNIIKTYSVSYKCLGAPNFDANSIMLYPIPSSWNQEKIELKYNTNLSSADFACVKRLYKVVTKNDG